MVNRKVVCLALLATLITACAGGGSNEVADPAVGVDLMPLPAKQLRKCEAISRLRPACPTRILRREQPGFPARGRAFSYASRSHIFFFEWGAPYPGLSAKNAPPRFFHINVRGGDLTDAFGFVWPEEKTPTASPQPKRRRATFIERVTWSGKPGALVLAPSYPVGGIDGDHLIFRWTDGGRDYAISIHAWMPLAETITALQAIVATMPTRVSSG
ncbi:MAG: hypothetical protein ACRDJI_05810 [Actinomycetota bacterium]